MINTMIRHFSKFFQRVCKKGDVKKAKKSFKKLVRSSYLFVNEKFNEKTILTLASENRQNELAIKNALIILEVLKKKKINFIKAEQEVHQEILDTMTSFFFEFNDSIKKNKLYRELFAFYVQREEFEYRENMYDEIIDFMNSLQTLIKEIKDTGKLLPNILSTTQATLKISTETHKISSRIDKRTSKMQTAIDDIDDKLESFEQYLVNEREKFIRLVQGIPKQVDDVITSNIILVEKETKLTAEARYDLQAEVEYALISDESISSGKSLDILLFGSNPRDTVSLNIMFEFRNIMDEIESGKLSSLINLNFCFSTRPEDIQENIIKYEPSIVHFSTHATETGKIILEDKNQNAIHVPIKGLSTLFNLHKEYIKCVILNTSFAEYLGEEISRNIDYVIGFPDEADERDTIHFSVGFYRGISHGLSIPDAFKFGIIQIQLFDRDIISSLPKLYISK